MGILYLNGKRFKNAVIAAAQRVLEAQERLNNINVFPVPDGDTGTNMALTLKGVADRAANSGDTKLDKLSEKLADSALMNARGNSGAVLAQFFQGLAEGFHGQRRLAPGGFADSVTHAVKMAEMAFSQPQEGTILTVMRGWAEQVTAKVGEGASLTDTLKAGLAGAASALAKTPQQLRVLAKAGVVDAGAQGFVYMLEGIDDFVATGKIEWHPEASGDTAKASGTEQEAGDMTYQYCTECLLTGTDLDLAAIRSRTGAFGNSLVVAGNRSKVRVHVHTNDPRELFAQLGELGTVSHQKFDDMFAQNQRQFGTASSGRIALITDSACDLPAEYMIRHGIRVVPVNITFGTKTYLDRVDITSEEVYRLMLEQGLQPTTSQPAPSAFLQTFQLAAENHDQALMILISSGLSGTYQAGLTAANHEDRLQVAVVDSKNGAVGTGLLVETAMEAIDAGHSLDEVKRIVEDAVQHTHIFICLREMTYVMRSGRVSKVRGTLAKLLNLVPILTVDAHGKAVPLAKTKPGPKSLAKLLDIVAKQAREKTRLRFKVCHAHNEADARYLAEQLQHRFGVTTVDVLPASPTIGAHLGPGTVAIAMQAFPAEQDP